MPRNRPVDYPSVHPPTAQPQLGLVPPQFPNQDRFSWQDASAETMKRNTNAEQQLEAGSIGRTQDNRQSKVPPLPTLPEHLSGGQHEQMVLPSQRSGQFQPQHATQFRPDIPRHLQQPQQPQQAQQPRQGLVQGPTPSYEASQAAYRQSQAPQVKMQEQTMYPGPYNASQAQLSAHALPMHDGGRSLEPDSHQSSEDKPEQLTSHGSQPQQPYAIHLAPDVNPLSPTSPSSTLSPLRTTNMQTFPPPAMDMQFPQATTFEQPQATQGGTWHHGLGSCAETTTCLSALACPCMVYGRTQYRLSMKSSKKDPTNMLGYSSINGSCLAWSVLCGVNILMTAIQHTRVRKVYNMEAQAGNVPSDCIKSICCCCCVLAQDEKEMRLREEQGRKADVNQGYKSPTEMMYVPPR